MIYLDNSATTYPKPPQVINSVATSFKKFGANPGRSGHAMTLSTSEEIYKCRKKIVKLFSANSAQDVAFTANCTQSLNMAIKGVARKGCHVITSNLEHNAVSRPLVNLRNRGIISFDVAKVHPENDDLTLLEFEKLIKPNTTIIVCTHVSNVFGIVLPIEKIGKLAHDKGITFIVDSAQSAGIFPIDIEKMNIDFLCMAGHKGLYGPMGTGVLVTTKGEQLTTIIEGGTGSASQSDEQPNFMPDKLESGTANTPGIIGLSAGVDFVSKKGIENIYKHEILLLQQLYNQMKKNDKIIFYTAYPFSPYYAPVLSFNIKGMDSGEVGNYFAKNSVAVRSGLQCAPFAHKTFDTLECGTVRVSTGVYNTAHDVDKFNFLLSKL